ncbi:DUF805 domain-containing protein [Ignatzschineria cameli]|uniref:DUF805 domain-containing protein n=1 Tax=Ignatzschineria cameli TaxID=2182793 RepID=A0A2U2ATC4_9GAMM|nr:DUF805 domain-containing protein [Ignatzschineria cameli]PWD87528.1 hypothetical protein DC080_01545 [Ignatzschineria cameli]PWD87972.1 hypothetical protein DC077_01450 [Ignatzschineria cameli]PWD91004.1 hypothetical protein DC079_02205 [Ignatzschineria cameli]PWD92646.1 hypothetical protein DC081_02205 [Ignatzschineria cameli]PWD93666.1 hypothetical protein DC078_02205 [Ignatzschineria cameli]
MSKSHEKMQKAPAYFAINFTGRIGRLEFANRFATYLVLAIIIYCFYYFVIEQGIFSLTESADKSIDMTQTLGRIIFHAGFIGAVILLNIRAVVMRLHDINLSGWWATLLFIFPYSLELIIIMMPMTLEKTFYYTLFFMLISLALLIRLFPFIMPGSSVANRYGMPIPRGKPYGLILLLIFVTVGSYFLYQYITLQTITITFLYAAV